MKKKLFGLFLLGISSTFSFNKMHNGDLIKYSCDKSGYPEIPKKDFPKKFHIFYCYDPNLNYYVCCFSRTGCKPKAFMLFKEKNFSFKWWEIFFNIHFKNFLRVDNLCSLRKFDIHKDLIEKHYKNIKNNKKLSSFYHFFNKKYHIFLEPNLCVSTCKSTVTLSMNLNKKRYLYCKEIDFQLALLKYMQGNKNKYSEEQIDLLKNSKILIVWDVACKEYCDKYIEDLNKNYTEEPIQTELKIPNSIIIGFAYDTRDNLTYNWIIDLGQDISVLFDYADN